MTDVKLICWNYLGSIKTMGKLAIYWNRLTVYKQLSPALFKISSTNKICHEVTYKGDMPKIQPTNQRTSIIRSL